MAQINPDTALRSECGPIEFWPRRCSGSLFFTLFPYRADFSQKQHRPDPYILSAAARSDLTDYLHTSLNALLFMPFGFALSQFFQRQKIAASLRLASSDCRRGSFLFNRNFQLYMPSRDSAWDDVIANAFGSFLGTVLGLGIGRFIFQKLSQWEARAEQFLSIRKISVIALIYFGVWLAISVPLQEKTHLNNWDPNSFLFVGYDAKRRYALVRLRFARSALGPRSHR